MTVMSILARKGHHVLTIEPTAALSVATKLLAERRIGALVVTGADHRIGPRAAADSGTNVSGPTAVLVPIGNAAGARQNRQSSVPVSPARHGPISSPANGCSSSCYALRSIGPSHDGECVAVRLIHVHDDDPDGEAA